MLTEEKIREILKDRDEHLGELLATWIQHERLIDTMLSNKPTTVYIVD